MFLGNFCGGTSLCVSKNQCVGLGSPLPAFVPPFWWVAFLRVAVLPCGPALSFLCGFWSSLCLSLLLFPLCPFSVLPLLLLLASLRLPPVRLLVRLLLPCLVLVGLLLCRLWRCRCLVWTRSPWSARTVVFVSVVLPLRLVPWVVRSRWTLCLLGCLPVLVVTLSASLLRSGTRLTLGLLLASRTTLSFEGFLGWLLVGSSQSVLLCNLWRLYAFLCLSGWFSWSARLWAFLPRCVVHVSACGVPCASPWWGLLDLRFFLCY